MVRGLIWSPFALHHKKEIFNYWNKRNHSKEFSRKFNRLFNEAAEMLIIHPYLGKPSNYPSVRLKLVRDYWLAYQFSISEIRILLIWDTRRNPEQFNNLLKSIVE